MILSVILVIVGFLSLIFGANWLVDGATALAKKYNVSDLAIGLTIVAFGTSAPEMIVNVIGSFNGYSDIVLGNIIGSNNFNLFIILGISALILPIKVQASTVKIEIPISLLATIVLFFLINDFSFSGNTSLSRLDSLIMLVMFIMFLYYVFNQLKNDPSTTTETIELPLYKTIGLIIIGLSGLILGGHLVVENSVKIANSLGISEKIIGLTIVAAGTSLPELVTSVVAATKKNSDIAIGNVIGSNIFNILLILSVSGLVSPIAYNPKFNLDFYILIGGTVFLLLAMLTGKRKTLDRLEAGILTGFYLLYTTFLVFKEI